jgi:hypothetical protein
MRYFSIICMMGWALFCSAQPSFFIETALSTKFNRTTYNGHLPLPTPYFQVYPMYFVEHPHLASIFINGFVGIHFKKNNSTLTIGFSHDEATSGYRISFISRSDSSHYYENQGLFDFGVALRRSSITYSFPLYGKNAPLYLSESEGKFSSKINLKLGLALMKIQGNSASLLGGAGIDSLLIYPNSIMSYESLTYAYPSRKVQLVGGLGYELFYKRKQLFEISCSYGHSLGRQVVTATTLNINIDNKENFNYNFSSKGSGFYVLVSKKIYFDRLLRSKSKKVNEKISNS